MDHARRKSESTLLEAIGTLRRQHGDTIAEAAVAAVTKSIEFIRQRGHGNIQIAVKDHRVAPRLKFEYYGSLEKEH